VIKNIITPGSNSGEVEVLRQARKHGISTGGFVADSRAEGLGVQITAYHGQARCDRENLRVADLTVLITVDDVLRPRAKNRMERLWAMRRCRSVMRAFAYGERTSVVHECVQLGVEVLNIVSLQNNHDSPEAERALACFLADVFKEAEQQIERKAPAIWDQPERLTPLRRRPLPRGPVAEFNRTNDRRFLPGLAEIGRNEIFDLVTGLPIDHLLKRQIIDTAYQSLESELQNIGLGNRQRKWFESTWQRCAVEAVRTNTKRLPRRMRATLAALTKHLDWDANIGDANENKDFVRMCSIAADTCVREERFLRTLLMLHLGGLPQSKTGTQIVDRLMKCHQRANHDFSISELNKRFQSVGGWNAVIEAGKANRWDREQDPFLEIGKNNLENLEADLFLLSDEFCHRKELWNPAWLAAFRQGLFFLCGKNIEEWRSWIGPPLQSQFLA
jgi:hypothetical protein